MHHDKICKHVAKALKQNPELRNAQIAVASEDNTIVLSGKIIDEAQRQKVLDTALAVQGVESVKDALVVNPSGKNDGHRMKNASPSESGQHLNQFPRKEHADPLSGVRQSLQNAEDPERFSQSR